MVLRRVYEKMKTESIILIAAFLFVTSVVYCQKTERNAEGKAMNVVPDNKVTMEVKQFKLLPANHNLIWQGYRCCYGVSVYFCEEDIENENSMTQTELEILLGKFSL